MFFSFLHSFRHSKKDKTDFSTAADSELLALYQKTHDQRIIGALFNRYTHLVYGVCLKYLKNDADAREAVMQIFEKLIADLKIHEISHFTSWLHSVSRNHCLMHIRQMKVQSRRLENFFQESALQDMEYQDILHLNNEADEEKRHQQLHVALGKLKKEQESCLRLMYLENKTYREVSELTGYDMKEVKSYIQNGKRNLQKILKPNGA